MQLYGKADLFYTGISSNTYCRGRPASQLVDGQLTGTTFWSVSGRQGSGNEQVVSSLIRHGHGQYLTVEGRENQVDGHGYLKAVLHKL